MAITSLTKNKQDPKKVFEFFARASGPMRNVIPFEYTTQSTVDGEYAVEGVYDALEKDVKRQIEWLKWLTMAAVEINKDPRWANFETKAIRVLEGDVVELKFEAGTFLVKDNHNEVFWELFYQDMVSNLGQERVDSFVPDSSTLKEKTRATKSKAKVEEGDNEYLNRKSKDFIKKGLEDILSDYFEKEIHLNQEEKEFLEGASKATTATIRDVAKASITFPLDEKTRRKYEASPIEFESYLALDDILLSDENKHVEDIELDLSDSKGPQNKAEVVSYVVNMMQQIVKLEPGRERVSLKSRKLGKHHTKSLYLPVSLRNKAPILAIDPGTDGVRYFLGEWARHIEHENLRGTDLGRKLTKFFVSKMDFEGVSMMEARILSRQQIVFSKLMEVGYELTYPDEMEGEVRLVQEKGYYEKNSAAYFRYKDWSQEEQESVKSLYAYFMEGEGNLEAVERQFNEVYLGLQERITSERARRLSAPARAKDPKRLEQNNLRKILRAYDRDLVRYILQENLKAERAGEYVERSTVEIISMFMEYLGAGIMHPFQRVQEKVTGDKLAVVADYSTGIFEEVIDTFRELEYLDKCEILGQFEMEDAFRNAVRKGGVKDWSGPSVLKTQIANAEKYPFLEALGLSKEFGFWNLMNDEERIEFFERDFVSALGAVNNFNNERKALQRESNVFKLLKEMVGGGSEVWVDLSKEEAKEIFFEILDGKSKTELQDKLRRVNYIVNHLISGIVADLPDEGTALMSEDERDVFFEERYEKFASRFRKEGKKIPKEVILEDYRLSFMEVMSDERIISLLKENIDNQEVVKFVSDLKYAGQSALAKREFGDLVDEEDYKITEKIKYYKLHSVVPSVKMRVIHNVSRDRVLEELVNASRLKQVEVENLPGVERLLNIVEGVGVMLDKVEHLRKLGGNPEASKNIFDNYEFEGETYVPSDDETTFDEPAEEDSSNAFGVSRTLEEYIGDIIDSSNPEDDGSEELERIKEIMAEEFGKGTSYEVAFESFKESNDLFGFADLLRKVIKQSVGAALQVELEKIQSKSNARKI